MGRIFRYVLADSAMLRPLRAEVIATLVTSDHIHASNYYNHNLLSGDSIMASSFAHMSLSTLFNQLHTSGPDGTSLNTEPHPRKSALVHHKRAPVRPEPANPVPIDWNYLGCFVDSGSVIEAMDKGFYWTAQGAVEFPAPSMMSADLCAASCSINNRYIYAALNGSTCYCFDAKPWRLSRSEECNRPCYNNEGEACGGDSAGSIKLTVYERDDSATSIPRPADLSNGYQYAGCYHLEGYAFVAILDGYSTGWNASNEIVESSPELCTQKCKENGHWLFAGLTTNGCFCSNNPPVAESKADEERCMAQCPDHADEACGGWSYVNFYMSLYRQQFPREPPFPLNATENGAWYYKGCYLAEEYLRDPSASKNLEDEASAEACIQYCDAEDNYDLAALLGTYCYCQNQGGGDFARRDLMISGQYCGNECAKNTSEPCGGRDERTKKRDGGDFTITLYGRSFDHIAEEGYQLLPLLVPGAVPWTTAGCYRDPNVLSNAPYKYQNVSNPSMDPEQCVAICKENNNWLYAMPYNDGTCYCSGDLPNGELEENANGGEYDSTNECNHSCLGHPDQYCGGPGRDGVARVRFYRNPLDFARTELVVSRPVLFIWSVVESLAVRKIRHETPSTD